MNIDKDTVVQFHYTLSAADGDFTETSGDEPVACLIGYNNVLPGVENALIGRQGGDEVEVILSPEEAYGPVREGAVQRVPIKHLATKGKLRPGMVVKVNTAHGFRDATLLKVGKFNVDLDTNHPLAGKTIKFHIRVQDVRAASAEEIAHGHAHGAGGHHH
jgi:FKBP-type peptidyl-prolyl cis-trans isomerase SlyD